MTPTKGQLNSYIRFGWPILSLVALIGIAVFLLLADIAREQDRTNATTTQGFVEQASQNWVSANASISDEYGLWSDAYERITLNYNQEWIDGNFFSSNADSIAILSPTLGLRSIYLNPELEAKAVLVKQLIASLDLSGHSAYQSSLSQAKLVTSPNGLFEFDGHLAVVAVQPIRPEVNFKGKKPDKTMPIDLVVAIKIIDDEAIVLLAQSYGLIDVKLHLGQQPIVQDNERITYPVKGVNGETLGWIDWANTKPGTASFARRVIPIMIGLIFLGLLTLVISQRLLAAQVKLSREAQLSAEAASKTKSVFLANVSHELRTPLNAIIGYSELVREDCMEIGAEQSVKDTSKVIGSAQHLLGLINDLLDHSKIEAGKMDLHTTRIDLKPLFEGVGEALNTALTKNNSQFILNCDPYIGQAVLDGMRLKQCLLNLVSNAAKFTKDGKVTMSARSVERDGVPFIRIAVRDTGVGMSEDTLAKLFAPFVQADASTASNFGGTGLGLVITRALIEAMGGQVSVESKLGVGSTFTILVPRGQAVEDAQTTRLERAA